MRVVTLRLSDEQHGVIRVAAAIKGQSLQMWISRACASVAGQEAAEGDGTLTNALRKAGMLDGCPKKAPTIRRARKG